MKPPICKVCGASHWFAEPHDLTNMPQLAAAKAANEAPPKPRVPTVKKTKALLADKRGPGRPAVLTPEEKAEKNRARVAAHRARAKEHEGT
jgi:hypothetical protein